MRRADIARKCARLFVHERRRLQAVALTLAGHEALRDSMELLLHERNQTRQRRVVATAPRQKQTRDIGRRHGNARNSTPILAPPRPIALTV